MTRSDDLEELLDEIGLVGDLGHTLLLVTGSTKGAVLAALGAHGVAVPEEQIDWDGGSAWAVAHVEGGVLAVEPSGFADPSSDVLARLSEGGRAAEADERSDVPTELRTLFDTAWCDPAAENDDDDPDVDPFAVAVAMAEEFAGIRVVASDLTALFHGERWHPVPYSFA